MALSEDREGAVQPHCGLSCSWKPVIPCNHVKEIHQPYFISDIYQLGKLTNNMWLTCPLAFI